jgi:hypothetical protein
MRFVAAALMILAFSIFALAPPANVAGLEPFGKLEPSGGAEKEPHTPAGARGTVEALGVWAFTPGFGVHGSAPYVGGLGSRAGLSLASVFAWDWGKVGGFVAYQHRGLRSSDFVHLGPSMAFYLDQMNFTLWYMHPVTGAQRGGDRVEYGVNKVQATASYFPGSDWASFLRKDNVEFMLGVEANTFAGAGHRQLGGTGVGPVLGISFLPEGRDDQPGRAPTTVNPAIKWLGWAFYDAKGTRL